jgi:hypothetical protein
VSVESAKEKTVSIDLQSALNRLKCALAALPEVFGIFETDRNPDQIPGDSAVFGPIQLVVMCEEGERAGQGVMGAEAGAFCHA